MQIVLPKTRNNKKKRSETPIIFEVSKIPVFSVFSDTQLWEVSEALALHELGGVIRPAETFNMQHVYTRCDHSIPVVFILPSSGSQDNSIKGDMHFMSLVHQLPKFR